MVKEHDYRQHSLNPERTLKACQAVQPGIFQLIGSGSNIQVGDHIRVSLKGSTSLELRLKVLDITPLLSHPNEWTIRASGPSFTELNIHQWQVSCDACQAIMDLEFAVESNAQSEQVSSAAEQRLRELGWHVSELHLCRQCTQSLG